MSMKRRTKNRKKAVFAVAFCLLLVTITGCKGPGGGTTTSPAGSTAPSTYSSENTGGEPTQSTSASQDTTGNTAVTTTLGTVTTASSTRKTTKKPSTSVKPTKTTARTYVHSGSLDGVGAPTSSSGRFVYKYSAGKALAICIQQPYKKVYENAPFVLLINGGGWTGGLVEDRVTGFFSGAGVGAELLNDGWALVSITYRGVDNGEYMPEMVADLMDGIAFIDLHKSTFRLDCTKIITCGASAPGHMSLLLATAPRNVLTAYCVYPIRSYNIIGCLAVNGFSMLYPTDGDFYYADGSGDNCHKTSFGVTYKEDNEVFRRYSPMTYISKNTVPLFLAYGTKDTLVNPLQTIRLKEKCDSVGSKCTLKVVKNGDHDLNGTDVSPSKEELVREAIQFMKNCLKNS